MYATLPARDRTVGALAAIGVQLLIGYALLTGLVVRFAAPHDDALALFSPAEPPPPPVVKVEKRPSPSRRPEGEAAPPARVARASPVIAPMPVVPVPIPPPVIAAPRVDVGADNRSGAAPIDGPGTGAGGIGDGRGSGGAGDGDGGGGEDTPPRWLRGSLKDSDFPDELVETGRGGIVGVRYSVEVNGRVGSCSVTRSSGEPVLDALTCRLIRERFRFRPSLDPAGVPVRTTIVESHEWVNELGPPEEALPVRRRR